LANFLSKNGLLSSTNTTATWQLVASRGAFTELFLRYSVLSEEPPLKPSVFQFSERHSFYSFFGPRIVTPSSVIFVENNHTFTLNQTWSFAIRRNKNYSSVDFIEKFYIQSLLYASLGKDILWGLLLVQSV
jgi:hypothetical protein